MMVRLRHFFVLLLGLVGTVGLVGSGAQAQECRPVLHLGDRYTVCSVADISKIGLWLARPDGRIYGEFSTLEEDLALDGFSFAFAMNGGMYHEDRSAVGLFVNDQGEQQRLMTRDGPGNFGLLPNGVFCVAGQTAIIRESLAFKAANPPCRIATQSGPMLVIDGALHPRFLPDSTSKKRRNGIGVDDQGHVHFAISEGLVRFHDFATLFRDVLKAQNALFLDGTVSRLHAPDLNRSDGGARMGPILGVIR